MLTVEFNRLALAPGQTLLDLGCGEGRHVLTAWMLNPEGLSVGLDLGFEDARKTRAAFVANAEGAQQEGEHWGVMCGNALKLPFADNSLDRVICSEVLEHIPDYYAALDEITRVLKPGGLLAVSVPRTWPEWICWRLSREYQHQEGGHVRIFRARRLRADIEARGHSFRGRHWAHALHSPYWWLRCLFWHSHERSRLVALYHRLLVWDIMHKPWFTQRLERLLNPLMGKSVVMYFRKGDVPAATGS